MMEILIAMAIGGIGVIAFAGLQLKSYEVSQAARERSNAAFIAHEMMERMLTNSQDFGAQQIYQGTFGGFWNVAPPLAVGNNFSVNSFCVGVQCTPAQMASSDIQYIKQLAAAMLPQGNVGHRACGINPADPNLRFECISVAWNGVDPNDAASCRLEVVDDRLRDCYQLQVKIW